MTRFRRQPLYSLLASLVLALGVALLLTVGLLRQQPASADGVAAATSTAEIGPRPISPRVSRSPYGDLIEFRGLIQEIDERYWIVSGRVVLLTETTVTRGRPQLGALAEVKGVCVFGDVVVARSLEVTVPGAYDQVEFEGTVESILGETWVVGGVTVTISPVTELQGTPLLGAGAEVRGVLQPDGSVLAEHVTVKGLSPVPQIDFAGLVEQIEATQWTLAGTTVLVDEHTFVDDSRAPAEVGVWAQVRAVPQGSSWLAVRIRLSRPN